MPGTPVPPSTPAASPPGHSPGTARSRPPSRRRRAVAAGVTGALVLVGAPTAWAVDRYLIEHVEIADVSAHEAAVAATGDSASTVASNGTTTATATTTAPEVTVTTVTTGSGAQTVTYYVADVVLDDATQLRSAFAQDAFGTNITQTTSAIAAANDALLAVNSDYYGFRETGIVIRNGVVYRDEGARTGLALYRDGTLQVYDETSTTADQLVADGVWQTLSFGPALLVDGAVVDGIDEIEVDTNIGNHSIQGDQPRTAIGMVSANHLVLVVVDGRAEGYSAGVDLTELAQIMADLGCTVAYNLDGGGSSTMVYDGELVNDPLGRGTERATSDILYVG